MGRVTLEGYKCDRCGHAWIPRIKTEELPTICPRCKSPYWNKPRLKNPRASQPKVKSGSIKNVRT